MSHTRRRFLQSAATTSALAAAGISTGARASAQSSLDNFPGSSSPEPVTIPLGELPFLHGVASGDPLPNTVMLWTRVTPSAEAMPGSGIGEDVTLAWDVARDAEFASVVVSGRVVATSAADHTVHVDPYGLDADTTYFYRFTVVDGPHAGKVSPVGRTVTAPLLDSSPDSLRFAVASCANWEGGFYTAYGDMARRGRDGELDFVLFLGDYLYEYASGGFSGFGPYRLHEPAHEIISLADYRTRYGQSHTDPNLQAAHAALPWIVVWDDHETANNSWRDGAENHDPATEGDWGARRAAAMQAYFEWLPVRATNPSQGGHIYRSFQFGDLADLVVMDLRTYRDKEAQTLRLDQFNDPGRTMLGSEQSEWLNAKIATSDAAWTIMGNSVMFSPLNLITLQENPDTSSIVDFLGEHRIEGIPLNGDQWDGYSAERRRLLDTLGNQGSKVLFCTGDIHTEWGHVINWNGREIGAEVVCGSITAANVNEFIKLPEDNPISHLGEELLRLANPHLRHVDLDAHGYATVSLDRRGVDAQWLRVAGIADPNSGVGVGHAWRWN